MKRARLAKKAGFWFWALLFSTYAVAAAGFVIDTVSDNYHALSQVSLTTVYASEQARSAGATQVAAVYRAMSGAPFSTLPPGSSFRIVWPDGSSEIVTIVSPTSTFGTEAVKGTQYESK